METGLRRERERFAKRDRLVDRAVGVDPDPVAGIRAADARLERGVARKVSARP